MVQTSKSYILLHTYGLVNVISLELFLTNSNNYNRDTIIQYLEAEDVAASQTLYLCLWRVYLSPLSHSLSLSTPPLSFSLSLDDTYLFLLLRICDVLLSRMILFASSHGWNLATSWDYTFYILCNVVTVQQPSKLY